MAAEISPSTKLCKNILIGVTGSVASVKLSRLVEELLLLQPKPNIQVIATDHSTHFFDEEKIPVKVYRDRDEWETCTIRAWDVKKPLLFCPAMNTFMWEHPITSVQVKQLIHMGYTHIPPIKKTLACGDKGNILQYRSKVLVQWQRFQLLSLMSKIIYKGHLIKLTRMFLNKGFIQGGKKHT
ncbi:phosphopantothenoylcysteine decarboxylase-like isoform X4 [Acropora muricata]|uniref:phosphopantothenoylcysteine decarboxylase-like isoform X4 n=1 Tax=Acropora muricata TaxID=159855 RepID=UPI0034E5AFE0